MRKQLRVRGLGRGVAARLFSADLASKTLKNLGKMKVFAMLRHLCWSKSFKNLRKIKVFAMLKHLGKHLCCSKSLENHCKMKVFAMLEHLAHMLHHMLHLGAISGHLGALLNWVTYLSETYPAMSYIDP